MLAHIGIALVSFFIGLLFGCGVTAMCSVAQRADEQAERLIGRHE